MSKVTTYGEMLELATDDFYREVCTFLGGMNYTLELLDHLGSCAYDLGDIIDRDGDDNDREEIFFGYVHAAEAFFNELDDVNSTYDEFRQRIVNGLSEECIKIKRLIAYRDDVVSPKLFEIKDEVSEMDFDKMWDYLLISKNEVKLETLNEEYEFVLNYLNSVDDGLRQLNEFGSMRDCYTERLFTEDEIVNCDRRFYSDHEQFNTLVQFTYNAMDVERFVTAIKVILVDNYGIELDAI